ncbi:hypothetical protein StoSoilA2_18670 [Arthrobacter sp. StoSoilA2]|nr:hypothetical protein StoSoilA2_18670 [Arthrobacter sp. StoSoilA2]
MDLGADDSALLAGLLGHEAIEVYRFSDEGVPASAQTLDSNFWGSAPVGWLKVTRDEETSPFRSHGVLRSNGKSVRSSALSGDIVAAIARGIAEMRNEGLAMEYTPEALMVAAAEEIGADILITRRQGLHSLRSTFVRGLTIVDVADAISIGGLFLRSRGEYSRAIFPQITVDSNKTMFYESSVSLFLPHQIEILRRSQLLAADRKEPEAVRLAAAAFRRMSRSIERRDQIWQLICRPQDIDTAEDMLALYEALLTSLMGAIDATARLANTIYQLPVPMYLVAWQRKDWAKELKLRASQLWSAYYEHPEHEFVLTTLRLLRNTIHAEGLESIAVSERHRVVATWIEIPPSEGKEIAETASQTADPDEWSIQTTDGGRFYADPGPMMDRLILSILTLLADVQLVLVADLRDLTVTPPLKNDTFLDAEAVDQAHRYLLGLGPV